MALTSLLVPEGPFHQEELCSGRCQAPASAPPCPLSVTGFANGSRSTKSLCNSASTHQTFPYFLGLGKCQPGWERGARGREQAVERSGLGLGVGAQQKGQDIMVGKMGRQHDMVLP